MIKRLLGIILFLSLSLFLVMPVYAADEFTKTTPVETGALDYRNSLIDWSGYNVDIDIIWDQRSGNLPNTFNLGVWVSGWQFFASTWDCVDYICELVLTPTQKQLVKNVIFSREYNEDRYIVMFGPEQTGGYFAEFRIKFKSLLQINFKSVYIIDSYYSNISLTDIDSWYKTIVFEDSQDNLLGGIVLDNETTQSYGDIQKAQYNFNNKYTNIKAIYLNYWNTKETTAYNSSIYNIIYQVALFADSQVILPNLDIDTDFQIYEPTICGAIDLGCVSRNLIGEFSNNIYKRLGAENMASGVMEIYDTIFYPVYIIDAVAWQNGIIAIYGFLSIGVLYLIVKRVLS